MKTTMTGWGSGLLGVVIFSGSLPATRVAVDGFTPLFLTSARAVIAALLALALLALLRQKRPGRDDLGSLVIVALGVVVGFPLLTAIALRYVTSAHSIVFIGLLPLCTALFGVLRGGERPRPAFWLFSVAGASLVAGFARIAPVAYISTPNLLTLAPEGAEKSDNPWHIKEYRLEEYRALLEPHFSRVEILGLHHARKLKAHELALSLGWDRVHKSLGLSKPFYDRFTPAISASDFRLSTHDLESSLDFLAVCHV